MNRSRTDAPCRGGVVTLVACWVCLVTAVSAIGLSAAAFVQSMWFSRNSHHANTFFFYAALLSFGTLFASNSVMYFASDNGLCAELRWSKHLRVIIVATIVLLLLCFVCCQGTVLGAVGGKGVPDAFPIMALREKYFLNSHNRLTEVPRSTYLTMGICGTLGFLAGLSTIALLGIYVVLFGRPKWMIRQKKPKEDTW